MKSDILKIDHWIARCDGLSWSFLKFRRCKKTSGNNTGDLVKTKQAEELLKYAMY